jgi:type I restriction enzyme M protein
MLNNSTTAAQTLNVSELLLNANWQRVESETKGAVFTLEDFAKGWDTIYVRPAQLQVQSVAPKMRKLTAPTFLLSSFESKMAYVLASEENPVYIPYEYKRDDKLGYLMAFRISPMITPEYLYYMCKYDEWKKFLSKIAKNEKESYGIEPHWNLVGITGDYDPISNRFFELNAETLVRNLGDITIPALEVQGQRVAAAKNQAITEATRDKQSPTVADILPALNKYMDATRSIFADGPCRIGLLRELYRLAAKTEANEKVLQILRVDQFPFTENVLSQEEMLTLAKYIDTVFNLLISPAEFSWTREGGWMQPQEVTDFMVSLVDFKKDSVVYNPFAGLASYSIALNGYNVVGEELDSTTWAIAQIRLFANGVSSNINLADSFTQIESTTTFDSIITSPAIFREDDRQPLNILIQLYNKLNDGGQLVCMIPTRNLQPIADIISKERSQLIEERSIKSIITLPSNIFTGISVSQSVIVLTKGIKNDVIFFGNASEYTRFSRSFSRMTSFDWQRFVRDMQDSIETYADWGHVTEGCVSAPIPYEQLKGDNLMPAPYLVPIPENGILLSEIAEIIRRDRPNSTKANYIVKPSDIPANLHDRPYVPPTNDSSEIRSTITIDGDAVILSPSIMRYKSVYLQDFHGTIGSPVGLFYFLKPKSGVSARYLAALFATKEVADQIKAASSGGASARISSTALMNIVIPQHKTSEEREQIISEVISSEMSEKERELSDRLDMLKTGLRTTRHAMVQTWSALQTNWEELEFFIQDNGGQMKLSDVIGEKNPISVKDMMATISHSLKTLSNQIDSLKLESVNWGEAKFIDPFSFIKRYIAKHTNPRYKMVNVGNDNHAEVPWFNDETGESGVHPVEAFYMFKAPERMVERIFDNIIANAVAHGFTDSHKDYRIVFDWKSDDDGIVITIANNGEPFKNGVTGEMVLTRGFTTELNPQNGNARIHSGQGGFEIKEHMDSLGGKVRVISDPDSELPVIYELTFTDTNFERVDL